MKSIEEVTKQVEALRIDLKKAIGVGVSECIIKSLEAVVKSVEADLAHLEANKAIVVQ